MTILKENQSVGLIVQFSFCFVCFVFTFWKELASCCSVAEVNRRTFRDRLIYKRFGWLPLRLQIRRKVCTAGRTGNASDTFPVRLVVHTFP